MRRGSAEVSTNNRLEVGVSSRPLDRVLHALQQHGSRVVTQRGDSHRVTCPAHSDTRPSLVVTARDGRILLRCFAGCRTSDVLAAIGLRFADLFDLNAPRIAPRIEALYPYGDLQGEIIAEKVRFVPKAFRWRRPDPTARTGWTWGLNGTALPLYRLPELTEARDVLLVEGEKSADLLTAHGFTATCPPSGASTWNERWTGQLYDAGCERLMVLADADREGMAHAQRVAAACYVVMRVKLVTLPGLPAKGDVVDFLNAGNTQTDLRQIIDAAPDWTPDADERDRQNRKRELARERKRKSRARQRQALSHAANDSPDNAASHAENVSPESRESRCE